MRYTSILAGALAAAAVLTSGSAARATTLSGSVTTPAAGQFVKLTIPFTESTPDNTVGEDNFQQNDILYAFDEGQNILIQSALTSDVGGTIAAGTVVASHYVFYDPMSGHIVGDVLFDSQILGIFTSTGSLAATDFLVPNGVHYENPGARGLEGGDFATISQLNPNMLHVDFNAGSPGDYVRVLTAFSPAAAAVPEPASLTLAGAAVAAALGARRRRS